MVPRRTFLDLPLAPAPEPTDDRRIAFGALVYPWLVQYYPRSPVAEDTLVPEARPEPDSIVDLLDL